MSIPTGKKILVVEDDEVNLMIAEHILGKEGHSVKSAINGEQAINYVQDESFDLILMDIEMPIMGGLEATPIIREMQNGKAIPIIALTAHSIPEKLEEFMHAGMNGYIIKPFDGTKFQKVSEKYFQS
ncbi:MAG: response regulator [Bacteroidia bacterium]|nr:response regulator [Bacteroidia bacterium]